MKQVLEQYALYNLWANQRLTGKIISLSPALYIQEVASSFNSLQATLLHMKNADSIWWKRLQLLETANFPFVEDLQMNEIVAGIITQSKDYVDFIQTLSEKSLLQTFEYRNLKNELFCQPVFQVLLQIFNHATYHRGQLVTILKQLGIDDIPPTDFIVWSRI